MSITNIFTDWWSKNNWNKSSIFVVVFWLIVLVSGTLAENDIITIQKPLLEGVFFVVIAMALAILPSAVILIGLIANICEEKPHVGWMILGGAIALIMKDLIFI